MGVEAEFGATLYRPLEELQFLAPVQSLHFSIIQHIWQDDKLHLLNYLYYSLVLLFLFYSFCLLLRSSIKNYFLMQYIYLLALHETVFMHPKNMGNNIQCTTTNKSPVHLHSYPAAYKIIINWHWWTSDHYPVISFFKWSNPQTSNCMLMGIYLFFYVRKWSQTISNSSW